MSEEKYVLVSLEDEKAGLLANVLANKTSKKILDLLSEKELSESEISRELNLPLNTIGYNINNLIKSNLIEEKRHMFSVKGKRIPVYKLASKYIVISPKKIRKISGIFPVVIISAIFSIFILWYNQTKEFVADNTEKMLNNPGISIANEAAEGARKAVSGFHLGTLEIFLIGIWILVIAFIIIAIVRRSK